VASAWTQHTRVVWVERVSRRGMFGVQTTSMKKLSVFGAFRFSEFRIRGCVPVHKNTLEGGILPYRGFERISANGPRCLAFEFMFCLSLLCVYLLYTKFKRFRVDEKRI
jgi:hypothetical protein